MAIKSGLDWELAFGVHHYVFVSKLSDVVRVDPYLVQKSPIEYIVVQALGVDIYWSVSKGIEMADKAHLNGYASVRKLQNIKISRRQSLGLPKLIIKMAKAGLFAHHM